MVRRRKPAKNGIDSRRCDGGRPRPIVHDLNPGELRSDGYGASINDQLFSISWLVVSAVGAGTVLSFAIIAEYFPKELAGRANAALNVFHLGSAFVFQWSTGLILEQWPTQDGHYPLIAFQFAFGLNVALQIAA